MCVYGWDTVNSTHGQLVTPKNRQKWCDELTVWRVDRVTTWPCDELTVHFHGCVNGYHIQFRGIFSIQRCTCLNVILNWQLLSVYTVMFDQRRSNSRFHGRDNFLENGLLPWKAPTSVISISAILREFSHSLSFTMVSEFYQQLLCRFCC